MSEKICLKNNVLEVEIKVLIFQNDNLWFYASPSLNLDAYGNTENEARVAFNELLTSHFQFQIENNLLDKDLSRLGWAKEALPKKKKCTNPFYHLLPDFNIPKKGRSQDERLLIPIV